MKNWHLIRGIKNIQKILEGLKINFSNFKATETYFTHILNKQCNIINSNLFYIHLKTLNCFFSVQFERKAHGGRSNSIFLAPIIIPTSVLLKQTHH